MASNNAFLSQSQAPYMLGAIISTYCLAIITLVLRIIARTISKAGLWYDDWLVIAGALLYTAVFAIFVQAIVLGVGRHVEAIEPATFETIWKLFCSTEIIFALGIGLVKCSVLAFYWRIFGVSSIKRPIWITGCLVAACVVTFIFSVTFLCDPPEKSWKPSTPGICISKFSVFLGSLIPEIVTNFIILAMPIPYIWRLQVKHKQKLLLTGVFLLGGFACISSILPLRAFLTGDDTSKDLSWTIANSVVLSCVEGSLTIIAACLPSLRPILGCLRTRSVHPALRDGGPRVDLGPTKTPTNARGRALSFDRPSNISDIELICQPSK